MSKEEVVDISEKNGILTCRIIVPQKNADFPYAKMYRTPAVIDLLTKKGYEIQEVLEETMVHNKNDRSNLNDGTWRFKLKTKQPTRAAKKTKVTKKE
tara:strand:+ start:2145 stop:2435 length:291 start_codon:yes stop_codon:yes gene_type:complete